MVKAIGEIKKDIEKYSKIADELFAIQGQLKLGIKSKGMLGKFRDYREKDFDATQKNIPNVEGQQLSPEEIDRRENAKQIIKTYHEVDGMSLGNIIEQNKLLLDENTFEVSSLKGRLNQILKAKEKIDAVCIRAESRIRKIDQEKRIIGLEKTELKDIYFVESYKDLAQFRTEKQAVELIDDSKTIEERLKNPETWFDSNSIQICQEKGIDEVPNKIEFVKGGITKRNKVAEETCVRLEESIERIDKTMEGKNIPEDFVNELAKRKKEQTKLISEIREIIKKPNAVEFNVAGDDWNRLKKIALDAFPVLRQKKEDDKTENNTEEYKDEFDEIIGSIGIMIDDLPSAADSSIAEHDISNLCIKGVEEIKKFDDVEKQLASINTLVSLLTSRNFGITGEINTALESVAPIICDNVLIENIDSNEKAILLSDIAVKLSKIYSFSENTIKMFFDKAVEVAHSGFVPATEYITPKAYSGVGIETQMITYEIIPSQKDLDAILNKIFEKSLEAGLHPEISAARKELERVMGNLDQELPVVIDMINKGDTDNAKENLNRIMNLCPNSVARCQMLCRVLEADINDNSILNWVDKNIDDLINELQIGKKLNELIEVTEVFCNADDKIKSKSFEIFKKIETAVGNDSETLKKIAGAVFNGFNTDEGRVFSIEIYKKVADQETNYYEIYKSTNELINLFEGKNIPYLKETALEMYSKVEEHIPEDAKKIDNFIVLYFTMSHNEVIDNDEALARYVNILESESENSATFALETPEAIKKVVEGGASQDLADAILDCAENRVLDIENPKYILEYLSKLVTFDNLSSQKERFEVKIFNALKKYSVDKSLNFVLAHYHLENKIYPEEWESNVLESIINSTKEHEDLIKIAEFASSKISDNENALMAYSRALDNSDNDLEDILEKVNNLSVYEPAKKVVISSIAEKMMSHSEYDLDKIENSIKKLKGKADDELINKLVISKMQIGDKETEKYNKELADLAIELGFEKAGLEIINSFDSEDTEVHVLEDMEGRRILDSDVESTEPLNEDTLREEVRSSRVAESKARSAKKTKKKEKPKGFFSWLSSFFSSNK